MPCVAMRRESEELLANQQIPALRADGIGFAHGRAEPLPAGPPMSSSSAFNSIEKTTTSSTSELRRLSSFLEISQALAAGSHQKTAMHQVLAILTRHHGALRSTIALLNRAEDQI